VLAAGEKIDQFSVIRLLGRGGMGDVYLARDATLGRKVALKVIQPERLGNQSIVDRFLFEARTTARFSHPNIVTVFAAGIHDGCPYLALEYLEGQSLRERAAEPWPAVREVVRIGLAIASALVEAHSNNVLHRDLKPENVLIPRDGRPRVVDFGIAKMIGEAEIGGSAPLPHQVAGPAGSTTAAIDQAMASALAGKPIDSATTVPPVGHSTTRPADGAAPQASRPLFGTPLYMAPEQWNAEESTGATDIWALGVILYELLAHAHPYVDLSIAKLSQRVNASTPAPALPAHADQPAELVALVAGCLAKQPALRPTAVDVVDRLEGLFAPRRATGGDEVNPFRGLLPFGEQHAGFFFGRDDEIAAFVERLREETVLPVVGPSGAGKSSFVLAGVVPRLREQGAWTVLHMRPGARPFATLAARLTAGESTDRALVAVAAPAAAVETTIKLRPLEVPAGGRPRPEAPATGEALAPASAAPLARDDLADELQQHPGLLALLLQRRAQAEERQLLLFVDQLEEICTLVDDIDVQRRFVQAICSAADDRQGPVRVIFTLRDDFLGRLALGAEARAALGRVTVLRTPGPRELEQIVSQPLAAVGYRFDDPTLPASIVHQVEHESACLPLLQFAAHELWSKRDRPARLIRRAAYEEMGTVVGALARHADDTLNGLSLPQQRLARALLLRLVTADSTRRTLDRTAALAGLGVDAGRVLDRLVEARLLAPRQSGDDPGKSRQREDDDTTSLELAHESLISQWRRLRQWIDESRSDRRVLAELEQAATQWWRRGQRANEVWRGDELRAARRSLDAVGTTVPETIARFIQAGLRRELRGLRRRRLLLAGLAAVALVAGAGTLYLVQQRSKLRASLAAVQIETARAARASDRVLEARARVRGSLEVEDSAAARLLWWQLSQEPLRWSVATGKRIAALRFEGGGLRADLADEPWHLLFDLMTGSAQSATEQLLVAPSTAPGTGGQPALATLDGRTVRVFDATSGALRNSLVVRLRAPDRVLFSPAGNQLVIVGSAGELQLWDWRQGGQAPLLGQHAAPIESCVFAPDGQRLVSAARDGTVKIWDLANRRELRELKPAAGWAKQLAFDRSGRLLAAATSDGTVQLWDLAIEAPTIQRSTLAPATRPIFAATGNRLVSAELDHTISLWDIASGARVGLLAGPREPVMALRADAGGRRLAALSRDNSVHIWDLDTLALERVFVVDGNNAHGIAFAPDGQRLFVGGRPGWPRLLDLRNGAVVELGGPPSTVHGGAFSPDGRQLATAGDDGAIELWDSSSGQPLGTLARLGRPVLQIDWSRRGDRLVCSLDDGNIRLLDRANGSALANQQFLAPAVALRFDHRGEQIGAVMSDRTVSVWRPATDSVTRLQSRLGATGEPVFSDDDAFLATWGRTPALWRIEDGRPLQGAPRGLAQLTATKTSWSQALVGNALGASLGPGNARLCLWTLDGAVEAWDVTADARRYRQPLADVRDVSATRIGCAVRSSDAVRLLGDDGATRFELPIAATAVAPRDNEIAVAHGDQVTLYDEHGARGSVLAIEPGATALLALTDWLVVGSDRGSVELIPWQPERARSATVFDPVPDGAVVALAAGPAGLLAGGFDNGALVLWDMASGRQLARRDFMAAVSHVAIDGTRCIAVSEAGEQLTIDLSTLTLDRCDLLRAIWHQVPVDWKDGLHIADSPTTHHCLRRW